MTDKSSPRKIAFNLYPDEQAGDRLAVDLLDETRLKERGRAMRAFLLTGAALASIDRRLPNLIAELATENVTLQDIQRIISSVIPDAFTPDDSVIRALLTRLGPAAGATDSAQAEKPVHQEDKNVADTRANSSRMFPDDE
ncbi:MAG: plasmid partitioning/stability family protein [Pantoea sp.]|uniref:Plasmid partitioning/stability family protein n=1 Tax=Mixta hanseatica TaxID=2872648 RepID=A0ABY4RD69_9GAMM|nr:MULTISPECIES: plasmid partitioning/stability family protein [Mixta]MDU6433569.1 plasmid partitioning/stability family protein [Pantoea sp.]UQY46308.1 plasmid partitioning/stability family protein [Mixta hanseatica]